MLKPGDKMEIDPRNPPTFVLDEGVTLEVGSLFFHYESWLNLFVQIGDEEGGFIPYEQYLANLAKQPPPTAGGTYIVQGGGDVVIQDENGNVITKLASCFDVCYAQFLIERVEFLGLEPTLGAATRKFIM